MSKVKTFDQGQFTNQKITPWGYTEIDDSGGGGGGAVTSVFGRTGTVNATTGDYDASQVSEASTPTNYTPTGANVLGHLLGIDAALGSASQNRAFADDTTVAPATTGSPTTAEIAVFATANTLTDTIIYYTGDDNAASAPTHVYHVDAGGNVTLLLEPVTGGGVDADAISPAADDATGAIGTATGEYALEDHKHPAQGVSADANNSLTVGTDGLHHFTEGDEVIENAGALSGAAPAGAQWGVDTTTGQAYYVSAGNWTVMPITTTDLNLTVSSQTGNSAGVAPISPPGSPDTGDIHLESYDDYLVWWSYNGTSWVNSAFIQVNPNAASVISPAADDGTGAVGSSDAYARQDHKHPAQGVSADANNALTVGGDGLHYYVSNDVSFADDTTVAPATTGSPTVAEITTFTTAGSITDSIVYYTGTDTSTDTPTHVYHVDASGSVTLLLEPAAVGVYSQTFDATTDWGTAAGGYYTLTITQATHGLTATDPLSAIVQEDDGTSWIAVQADSVTINKTTGDVAIQVTEIPDGRFAGRCIIR